MFTHRATITEQHTEARAPTRRTKRASTEGPPGNGKSEDSIRSCVYRRATVTGVERTGRAQKAACGWQESKLQRTVFVRRLSTLPTCSCTYSRSSTETSSFCCAGVSCRASIKAGRAHLFEQIVKLYEVRATTDNVEHFDIPSGPLWAVSASVG